MTERLRVGHVVTPTGVLHDAVVGIDGERLSSVATAAAGDPDERLDGWLVPGFVDLHVHGGGGFDFATTDPEQVLGARNFHLSHGTTTTLASLVTAPIDQLCAQLDLLAGLTADGVLAGVHLEGPFLSPAQAGAHDPARLLAPDPATVARLIEAGRGSLQMITMAPELPGAFAAIDEFVAAGVRVAVGHTDADLDTVQAAIDRGATVGTHLFNAMRAIHHREPGPVPALLNDERICVELIADGIHLHPEILRLAVEAAPDRAVLVTDAMIAAGMSDGRYALGGLSVEVRDGVARLIDEAGRTGSIAGSTLTMAGAVRRMVGLLGDVAAVSAMASKRPARLLGLVDRGSIETGARADLCLLDDDGALRRVMLGGRWIDRAS